VFCSGAAFPPSQTPQPTRAGRLHPHAEL